MMETIRIRQQGYAFRQPHKEFFKRYLPLEPSCRTLQVCPGESYMFYLSIKGWWCYDLISKLYIYFFVVAHLLPSSYSLHILSSLLLPSPYFSSLFSSFSFIFLLLNPQQLVDFLSNMLNVHDESWQLGTTKIFIKSVMNEKLDRLLWVRYSSSSRRIQVMQSAAFLMY